MVRTKDKSNIVTGGKTTRKAVVSTRPGAAVNVSTKSKRSIGGNRARAQPIPDWQHKITGFLVTPPKKKRVVKNRITDDDEENEGEENEAVNRHTSKGAPTCTITSGALESENDQHMDESENSDDEATHEKSGTPETVLKEMSNTDI